jgi:hypothetical protein
LSTVGVRKKGPIKAYAVAMYGTNSVQDKLAALSGNTALTVLLQEAKRNCTSFCLEMNFKVGAEKFSSAIAESVVPRHKGSFSDIGELQE